MPITPNSTKECSGCGACVSICPKNAITMVPNTEGFLFPVVNPEKCINCNLCAKVCPVNNVDTSNSKTPEAFAVQANDEIRLKSSSGGVFTVLALYILKQGGYVCGAGFDDSGKICHQIISNENDLKLLQGSKYVQSVIGNTYKEVKNLLGSENLVFFTGTPCQVAGLKSFLGRNYDNLITADLICHGVPSPKVFQKYIAELVPQDEKFKNTVFRDKNLGGWENQVITTHTSNQALSSSTAQDDFMRAFLGNISLRGSCSNCPFQSIPMQGDVTLGDFWGINNYDPGLNDGKGTSLLLINNPKGKQIIKNIEDEFKTIVNMPLKAALASNPHLTNFGLFKNANRKLFFELLDKKTLKECNSLCLDDICDYLIINFWWGLNYGANLTAYAIQEE